MSRRHTTITTEVDVCVDAILAELDDKDLLEEIADRSIAIPAEIDLTLRAYEELRRGNHREAEVLLERAIFPKFKTFDACQSAYAAAKANGVPR